MRIDEATWRLRVEHLTLARALRIVLGAVAAVALTAGLLMRLLNGDEYSTAGAFWWSVQTVTTVGYGDNVPTDAVGRWIAVGTMISALALIPLVTTLVTTALVSTIQRRHGMHTEQVLARIETRLDAIERRLAAVQPVDDGARDARAPARDD